MTRRTRTGARIQEVLLRLMNSFVIAHRLSAIRDADKVVVIDNGEIVEQGYHQQLAERKGFYHPCVHANAVQDGLIGG